MNLAILTTSWPSEGLPWAGHFIRDLAVGLQGLGHNVSVATLAWAAHGRLDTPPGMRVTSASLQGAQRPLREIRSRWPQVLWKLRSVASTLRADLWMAHWWPTLLAAPRGVPALSVLHGSDVDMLERCPKAVARWLVRRSKIVAVSPALAERFHARTGLRPSVCLLGAHAASSASPVAGVAWEKDAEAKILTVARDAPGKGLSVARAARRDMPSVSWQVLGGRASLTPPQVRSLVSDADLVVVPSRQGPGLPGEGRPHIITQALVAGVPVVGGPNLAVRAAMREAGQVEVAQSGPRALAAAIRTAIKPREYEALRTRAAIAGRPLRWDRALTPWAEALALGASR